MSVGEVRGSVRSVWPAVVAAEAAHVGHLPQEEQLVDLSERPVEILDGDAADERGQVGRFVRRQALQEERPVDGSRREGRGRREGLRLGWGRRYDAPRPDPGGRLGWP